MKKIWYVSTAIEQGQRIQKRVRSLTVEMRLYCIELKLRSVRKPKILAFANAERSKYENRYLKRDQQLNMSM